MRQKIGTSKELSPADRAAQRRFVWQSFCACVRRHRRLLALAVVLAVALFCVSRVHCSLAVSMNGSLIGYVEDQERLELFSEVALRLMSSSAETRLVVQTTERIARAFGNMFVVVNIGYFSRHRDVC